MLDLTRVQKDDWKGLTADLVAGMTPDELLDLYHSALWVITDPSYLAGTHNGWTAAANLLRAEMRQRMTASRSPGS